MQPQPRILVVDDHHRVRAGIRHLLEEDFPTAIVVEAGTAEEALALAASDSWSAILLDVNLPGRHGIAALPDIRAQQPDVPIVMVSGVPREQYAAAAMRAGASAFVSKERLWQDLAPVLRELLIVR